MHGPAGSRQRHHVASACPHALAAVSCSVLAILTQKLVVTGRCLGMVATQINMCLLQLPAWLLSQKSHADKQCVSVTVLLVIRWARGMPTPNQGVHLVVYLVLPEAPTDPTSSCHLHQALLEACQALGPCLPAWQADEAPALKVCSRACLAIAGNSCQACQGAAQAVKVQETPVLKAREAARNRDLMVLLGKALSSLPHPRSCS